MRICTLLRAATAALAIGVGGIAQAGDGIGPDVITGELIGSFNTGGEGPQLWGVVGDIAAYSIGTTSCNEGDVPLDWFAQSNQHPVIATNMFRIKDGAIEQIGMAWLKHGFCALQQTACGPCTPAGGGCASRLGVGCSDPYSSSINGSQGGLGPRSEVVASTGYFDWPYSTRGQTGNAIYKRLQVHLDDLNPSLNPGAVYLGDGHYVAPDDAAAGNGLNNASYRRFTVGTPTSGAYNLNWAGPTQRTKPAIKAWKDHGLGPNQPDPDVHIVSVDVPDDGRFWIGYKVSENGDGTYRYEYAVQNLNSHRSGGDFAVPLGVGAVVTNVGFNDIKYHSGEPYDDADWTSDVSSGAVSWSSPQTFAQNPNSNALRWSTLYNFRFDSDAPPVEGEIEIGLFRPGTPGSVTVSALVPGSVTADCPPDLAKPFGVLDIFDVLEFLALFEAEDPRADFAEPFGVFDIFDVLEFLALFEEGCP